jgi:hypothetical protein
VNQPWIVEINYETATLQRLSGSGPSVPILPDRWAINPALTLGQACEMARYIHIGWGLLFTFEQTPRHDVFLLNR